MFYYFSAITMTPPNSSRLRSRSMVIFASVLFTHSIMLFGQQQPSLQDACGESCPKVRCFVKFKASSAALGEANLFYKQQAQQEITALPAQTRLTALPARQTATTFQSSALKILSAQNTTFRPVKFNMTERWTEEVAGGLNRLFIVEAEDEASLSELLEKLSAEGDVEYVEPELYRKLSILSAPMDESSSTISGNADKNPSTTAQTANDRYFSQQWYLQNVGQSITSVMAAGKAGADINIVNAWDMTTGNSSTIVATMDTGVPMTTGGVSTSTDFTGRFISPYNFSARTTDASDNDGHGTNIASIIGATGNNSQFVAGINWRCRIMPLKVTSTRGTIPSTNIVDALRYAADNGAKVINMSLGGSSTSSAERDALRYAASRGVISVAAMGNDNTSIPDYPAAYSLDTTTHVIAVGATDNLDTRCNPFVLGKQASGGSNYGSHISFVAPGNVNLGIDKSGTSLSYYSGTSQATPVVTGIISLMLALKPSMSFQDVMTALKTGARDRVGLATEDTPGWDQYYGWGRVDAYRSLARVVTSVEIQAATEIRNVSLYPNPASSALQIDFQGKYSGAVKLRLINTLGITQYETTLVAPSTFLVDVSNIPSGMYRVLVISSDAIEQYTALIAR
jgi:hypothetical protein